MDNNAVLEDHIQHIMNEYSPELCIISENNAIDNEQFRSKTTKIENYFLYHIYVSWMNDCEWRVVE